MIFLNSQHELRSGWKFATYVAFFLLIREATGIALSMLVSQADLAINEIALLVPAVGAMWLTVRFVDHRPFRAFGVGFLPGWRRDLLSGLGMAAGMLVVLIAGCYAFGYVSMGWTGGQASVGSLLATLSLLLLAAANEELVFRGFPLQVLIDGIGEWPAIIGMSAIFGALHMNNPSVSHLGILNTIVAGILLSLAYARTRSLWLPYAIHVGWNVGLGFVFGFRLSGIKIASLWTTGTAASETILGGNYGPEGGLLATFVFAASAVIVERNGSINSTQASVGGRTRRRDRNRTGDA
jgi:membrane protease YdiL (CAAX protease family)